MKTDAIRERDSIWPNDDMAGGERTKQWYYFESPHVIGTLLKQRGRMKILQIDMHFSAFAPLPHAQIN